MLARLVLLAALGLSLPACAGVHGSKGNDTGGIIPWSAEAEAMAMVTANNNCNMYGKHARITSVRRVSGDYIAYQCRFDRSRGRAIAAMGQAEPVSARAEAVPVWTQAAPARAEATPVHSEPVLVRSEPVIARPAPVWGRSAPVWGRTP